jgi:hypothetical protein
MQSALLAASILQENPDAAAADAVAAAEAEAAAVPLPPWVLQTPVTLVCRDTCDALVALCDAFDRAANSNAEYARHCVRQWRFAAMEHPQPEFTWFQLVSPVTEHPMKKKKATLRVKRHWCRRLEAACNNLCRMNRLGARRFMRHRSMLDLSSTSWGRCSLPRGRRSTAR